MQKPPAFALCPIRSGSIPCNVRRAESCVGLLVHRPTTNEGGYLDKDTKYDTTAVRVGVDMLDTAVMDSACWTRRGVLVIASDPPTRRPKNAHACIHSRPAASSTHPPPALTTPVLRYSRILEPLETKTKYLSRLSSKEYLQSLASLTVGKLQQRKRLSREIPRRKVKTPPLSFSLSRSLMACWVVV